MKSPRPVMSMMLGVVALVFGGCQRDEPLPPVFGAVFGISGAAVTPFSQGRIPEPIANPGDRLVGSAANNPGLCIWQNRVGRRFRAECPEGYTP